MLKIYTTLLLLGTWYEARLHKSPKLHLAVAVLPVAFLSYETSIHRGALLVLALCVWVSLGEKMALTTHE